MPKGRLGLLWAKWVGGWSQVSTPFTKKPEKLMFPKQQLRILVVFAQWMCSSQSFGRLSQCLPLPPWGSRISSCTLLPTPVGVGRNGNGEARLELDPASLA